jgi:PAS domain S-box-containing protein
LQEEIEARETGRRELENLRRRLTEYEEYEAKHERVDRAVRLSERYFRSLVENISDVVTIVEKDGTLAYCSPSITGKLGYGDDELLGRSVLEYVHPDDAAEVAEALARLARDPSAAVTVEYRLRHKDGSWLHFEGVGRGIVEGSETSGIIFDSRDISDRKSMENKLRRSEQLYGALLRHSKDMICILDRDFRFMWASASTAEITGYRKNDAYGKSVLEFVHPDDVEKVRKSNEKVLQLPGVPLRFDFRYRHKDGSYHYHEGFVTNLLHDPDIRGIITNSRDITERVMMEESLREHRGRLAELVGERTRELQLANEQLRQEVEAHRRLEELLQKREEYFRSLIENSYDVIGVLEREGSIKYISPSVGTFGYEPEELEGKNAYSYIHPDDLPVVLEIIDRGVKIPGYTDFAEFRLRQGDGSWRWVEVTGCNMLDNPAIEGIVIHLRDVTERRQVSLELKRSEEYFHTLIDSSTDLIIVVNEDMTLRFVSPSVEELLGYCPEEVVGRSSWDFLFPEDIATVAHYQKESTRQPPGLPVFLEVRARHKDGSMRIFEVVGRNLLDNPAVNGYVVNAHDVTERRLMEEFLRESEEKYRSLVEDMNDVVLTLDNDGLITYVSPAIERNSSYRAEELIGRSFAEFIHPDDLPTMLERRNRLLAGEEDSPHEYRMVDKDGSLRYVRVSGRLITREGRMVGHSVVMSDVTKRRLAEDALRESEEKFRLISEQSLMGILIIQDGVIKYANRAASEIYGHTPEETRKWAPMEFLNSVHPEDREFVREQVKKKQRGEGGGVLHYSYRIIAKNGEMKWLETYANTVPYRGRNADLVTVVDITERKRMEEELRESEERFRTLIEKSSDAVNILDGQGIVTYMSPSVENILGYRPEELVGKSIVTFVHPFDAQETKEKLRALMENPHGVVSLTTRARNKRGEFRHLQVTARNFLDDPVVNGLVVNFRDISEEKTVKDRLEMINHLFLSMGVDLIANMEKVIEACRSVMGASFAAYSRMERGKFSILSTATGEDSLIITEQAEPFLSYEIISAGEKEPRIIENLAATPYAVRDPLIVKQGFKSFLGYPVLVKEVTIGCLGVYLAEERDFTQEEIETVGMLARALSVEEERLAREQGLKDFIDVASHELRHPITLMKGYALTLRDYGERLPEDAKRDYLTIIGQGADRLDMLIKELLDVSRIERGRFSLARREVRLEPLIERAVGEMRGKGISDRFIISIPDELPSRSVDPEKLVRTLVILLDNAAVHNPENTEVELAAEVQGSMVVISVMDRGVGVPEKERERIFERFYQVEDALHHSAPGMGLGLYIAREIVEAHGGKIWYEPREGGGSIFRFTLP